ncbi:MAG: anthranilate phosphoribosyltransferase [Methanomicrobiales archaeon]|nr:anthranilate phosphoribosyltransferase [Methanomicrobiales archaeon]
MIRQAIARVAEGFDLSQVEASSAMEEIVNGGATDAQIGALLIGLHMKGESSAEIAAFAQVLLDHAVQVRPHVKGTLVDTCGTGGDHASTFNISTTAAFVAAGAGVPVVKHGNRGVSSACGSADVLEALGVRVDIPPAQALAVLDAAGICFLFAPSHHPAMARVLGPRREIGIRTVFNLLGPLVNPAQAQARVMGVFSPALTGVMAEALMVLGVAHAMVVHGEGLDEITTCGMTRVAEIRQGAVQHYKIGCEEYGIPPAIKEDLEGGSPQKNAEILTEVLSGEHGAHRDIVLINAAAAIYLGGKSRDMREGVDAAKDAIDQGMALSSLHALIEATGVAG